ncbi:hypothetical protein BRARA_C04332 [Brassica rapa]|uniref:Uncharacterized protein n=2 Tax=Brassica TaxID=3705 RepID=A0A398A3N7_BRACM|nr:cold-regulated 413 plasma membrane protein 2 [Brassica napus]RID72442.1 hypothetical protein BRARA_C04332 [Brassica rapa]CAF2129687.1 unnamed protein product [Brassica napus]CAG7883498.1 unnamed protein product [Brassica rapa]VDC82686.1 unnamed protein product [Brassica rapa]
MGRVDYLAMKTDVDKVALVNSDVEELKIAAKKLFRDVTKLGGAAFGVSFVKWMACFAAIYLLILDRTNWRSKMLTSLLIPYIFLSLPGVIFNFLSGDVGKWIAFVAVVLRLFFPKHFPDWLEMPGSLILLLVVSPHFLAHHIRGTWIGSIICLFIGCYLLQEHIRVSGGFRNSFTQPRGVSNTLGIILILVYPVWALIVRVTK